MEETINYLTRAVEVDEPGSFYLNIGKAFGSHTSAGYDTSAFEPLMYEIYSEKRGRDEKYEKCLELCFELLVYLSKKDCFS